MKIPIVRPWFDEAEENAVLEVLRNRYVSQGENVRELERLIASYVNAKYAVAVSSCTAALHIAVLAAGIGTGDEVLVPAFTWISTINAVEAAGARPVFCDIDPATFNIDVTDARRRITGKTRAIIPVHLFGLSADLTAVMDLQREKKVTVIEDAACALGSYYQQKHVGTFGTVGCFSFHPRKSITTGEGGMLITSDSKLLERFLSLRNIGSDGQFPIPDFPILGFNYRMTDLHAALGVAQVQKLNTILEKRHACARRYDRMIAESELSTWLQSPVTPSDCVHSYQAYVCQIRSNERSVEDASDFRSKLIQKLASDGIEVRPGTHGPYLLTYYRKKYSTQPQDYPNAFRADRLTIALPLYPELTAEDQQQVCEKLKAASKL